MLADQLILCVSLGQLRLLLCISTSAGANGIERRIFNCIVPALTAALAVQEVCGWINAKASVPVWAKMTPNITDITVPARTALAAGCEGVAAINTITSVMGINLDTLRPEPSVEGYSTPGGYSSKAVKPIALAKVRFRHCLLCCGRAVIWNGM